MTFSTGRPRTENCPECGYAIADRKEAAEQRRRAELYEPLVEALKEALNWANQDRPPNHITHDKLRVILARCEKEG